MNLEQWQRSKEIKAEAEAAAKRTVERVLKAVKEPAMSEFEEFEPKFDEWWEENYMNVSADRTEAFDIYSLGLKRQQAKVDELQKRVDAVVIEIEKLYLSGVIGFGAVKKLEQALKGGESNES